MLYVTNEKLNNIRFTANLTLLNKIMYWAKLCFEILKYSLLLRELDYLYGSLIVFRSYDLRPECALCIPGLIGKVWLDVVVNKQFCYL